MKNYTYIRLIENLVADIITIYEKVYKKPISIPIPVIDIAEGIFHLRVDTEKLKGKLARKAGVIIPEKRWMILNSNLDQPRLNFTVAHELAHWLIDTRSLGLTIDDDLLTYPLASRNPRIQETLANYFAATLLMPKHLLANEVQKYEGFGTIQLMALSSMFNVSTRAMAIRLGEIRNELDSIKAPIRLLEPLEYGEINRRNVKRWKYIVVNADFSIVDHNLHRKLQTLKEHSDNLYVIWSMEETERIETLLEFHCIDGFIYANNSTENSIKHFLGSDPAIRFVDLDNGLWLDHLNGLKKDLSNKSLVFFPRSDEKLSYEQKELLDINRYIDTPVKLNYREDAKKFIEAAQAMGKRVVIVTGCFDLITNAHVRFLKRAKAVADILVVGLEDDNRVRAFKGEFRPVNTISQRVELMDAFKFVDFTFVISGSPKFEIKQFYTRLHSDLKADILAVSENDSNMQDRKEEIEAGGGRLAIVSQIEESSTTSLLRQFLTETELSDIVYVSRYKVKDYLINRGNHWRQLVLPMDPE